MPEIPNPDSASSTPAGLPAPDADHAARRARLLANLDLALGAAQQLGQQVANAFPMAEAEVRAALAPNLSVEERLRLGESAACELTAIALHLDPEMTLDGLESTLEGDRHAQREAAALIARVKSPTR